MSPKYLHKKSGKKKKVGKMRKEKGKKRKKNVTSDEYRNKKDAFERSDFSVNEKEKYSRSYIGFSCSSKVKHFSQIREHYFTYLQTVVMNNCVYCNSHITDELLESLSLELEQHALLASLQVDIYEKCMIKIISEIKKCTEEKQVFSEVKKLLPEPQREKHVDPLGVNMKTEKTTSNSPAHETSQIPILCNTRSDYDVDSCENSCSEPVFNSDVPNPYFSDVIQYQNGYNGIDSSNEINAESHSWQSNEYYCGANNNSNFWYNEGEIMQPEETSISNFDDTQTYSFSQPSNCLQNDKTLSSVPSETTEEKEKVDPLVESRNQLQKSVEKSFIQVQNCKEKQEEKERAYIAHILQGEDSIGSFSDLENEFQENEDETKLTSRLEKMREIFGIEDEESQNETISNKPKEIKLNTKVNHINNIKRRPSIWKHEKVIQLYKFSMLSSEMSLEKRTRNRRLFLKLFGEDSDEEHELEYSSEEKYRLSCTERISSWVVKYLMPYYHDKRIVGRSVFKTLGHHVSETIIDKIQYPDEWTVKYFVSKFFPPTKKYISDADVSAFVPE